MDDFRILSTVRPFVGDVGCCIYCRTINTTNLGREHVIPHSLGGGIILRNASCKFHEKMTRHFENECAGKSWEAFRAVKNLPSYNKKNRRTHFPAKVKNHDGDGVQELPLSQYPDIFPIPAFEKLPGLITGKTPGPPPMTLRIYHNKIDAKLSQHPLGSEISIEGVFHIGSFIRLTAKIAHGYAIAHFGFGFHPFLLDIIEGDLSESGKYIGASHKAFDVPASANRHIMGHETKTSGAMTFIFISVGLFAGLGAPVHTVIAGVFDTDTPPAAPEWLK